MNRYSRPARLIFLALFGLCATALWAQPQRLPLADSTLVGVNVFDWVSAPGAEGNRVRLVQSPYVAALVQEQIEQQRQNPPAIIGYRVRIFFDNRQTARSESARVVADFTEHYPEVAVYLAYRNPYFKVTVGDFRTRSAAVQFLQRIKPLYPQAFVTKEEIHFPPLGAYDATSGVLGGR